MCGRYGYFSITPDDLDELANIHIIPRIGLTARYNIAPSQRAPVIPNVTERRLEFFQWGLIPSWAKDTKIGYKLINARAETVANKPSFRNAFRCRRCLVPADGFFEWRREKTCKVPHFVRMRSKKPFAMAGLWDKWTRREGEALYSFTIITTQANQLVGEIHDRMPVILQREDYHSWLEPQPTDARSMQELLKPYPSSKMEAFPVSKLVNSLSNDFPDVILPQIGE